MNPYTGTFYTPIMRYGSSSLPRIGFQAALKIQENITPPFLINNNSGLSAHYSNDLIQLIPPTFIPTRISAGMCPTAMETLK